MTTTEPSVSPVVPEPPGQAPRLGRASRGRVVAGVCRGLSLHLGVDVTWIRVAFVVLAVLGGVGIVLYAAFWALAPLEIDEEVDEEVDDGADGEERAADSGGVAFLLGIAALALGALLLVDALDGLDALGIGLSWSVAGPLVVAGLGVAILWRAADDAQRQRWRAATGATRWAGATRAVVGLVLVVAGLAVFLGRRDGASSVTDVVVAALVVVAGLAMISAPWWLRMARELSAERAARIREQERAEIAAHVHDSVLHTLTLIQRNVEDPREVARLARAQERELRTWLYRPEADPDTTLTAAVERVAADVEDAHGVTVDVVVVGDRALDDRLRALLLAAREALVNAAKYAGGAAISLYAEVEADAVTVFVRDRGPGFDLDAVPPDRLGIRQSVLGRMERHGGRAAVHTAPGEGTEVSLEMPLRVADRPPERGGVP